MFLKSLLAIRLLHAKHQWYVRRELLNRWFGTPDAFIRGEAGGGQECNIVRRKLQLIQPKKLGIISQITFFRCGYNAFSSSNASATNGRTRTTISRGGKQTVEVAHEALISNWSTLRAWVCHAVAAAVLLCIISHW
jgi:hypothetical protein